MDSLYFSLVRPTNRLMQLALFKHFARSSEKLTSFNAKLIQRYALLDYVDHRTMLTLLTEKASCPFPPAAFASLRSVLQAVHRFPLDFAAEKRTFEEVLLNSVLATPPDALSSVECGALWLFATQTTEWDDVLRLSRAFSLQSTLSLQSEKELRVLLNQMLLAAVPLLSTSTTSPDTSSSSSSFCVSAPTDLRPRGVRLLRELVGEDAALEGVLNGIIHRDAYWAERESAVYTFVGVVHALGRWPNDRIPDAKAWKELALRPTTFHDVSLHQLLRMLVRFQDPVVPDYVRESLYDAMTTDLWRCYSELPNEPVAAFFGLGELRLRFAVESETAKRCGGGENTETSDLLATDLTLRLRDELRRLHECATESQLRTDGPPLSLFVLINLLIGSTFLHAKEELVFAILSALRRSLSSSSVLSSSGLITPLQAAIIAICLDKIQDFFSTCSANVENDLEVVSKLLVPFLSYAYLKQRGCARCVAMLLSDCPSWTRKWQLEEGCFNLLREHAHDGFTKAQLHKILECEKNGFLLLSGNVKEVILQRAAEAPNR